MWKAAITNAFLTLKMWKKCVIAEFMWDGIISMMTEKDFWDKFHKKHNPEYYAKKKTKEKKAPEEKKSYRDSTSKRYPVFKVSGRMD